MKEENTPSTIDDALSELLWPIDMSAGTFSLLEVVCNYADLRKRILKRVHKESPLKIQEIWLDPSTIRLREDILRAVETTSPDAVFVLGFEFCNDLDQLFIIANYGRDEFRNNFPFPMVLWFNDDATIKLMRIAPDFYNWIGLPTRFRPSDQEFIRALQGNADRLFGEILGEPDTRDFGETGLLCDLSDPKEFRFFLRDIKDREMKLTLELDADLNFLRGWHEQNQAHWDSAICFYEQSLCFWESFPGSDVRAWERQGILFCLMARCREQKGDSDRAKSDFRACIERFESRPELAARCACELCEVLEKAEDWTELWMTLF